MKTIVQNKFMV